MNFKTLRNTLLIALPAVVFLCFIGKLINNDCYWVNFIFAVSLSGLVGLGTNSIAIRMLFRPKYPTCFGKWRQGILPRHQNEIADTIGEAAKKDVSGKKPAGNESRSTTCPSIQRVPIGNSSRILNCLKLATGKSAINT